MTYTLEIIGHVNDDKDVLFKGDYDDLSEAKDDAERAYDYMADDYDKIECTITNEQGAVRFHRTY